MARSKTKVDTMPVCYPKKGDDDKTYWVNVGVAWRMENGNIKIKIDAVPLNFTGELVVFSDKSKEVE